MSRGERVSLYGWSCRCWKVMLVMCRDGGERERVRRSGAVPVDGELGMGLTGDELSCAHRTYGERSAESGASQTIDSISSVRSLSLSSFPTCHKHAEIGKWNDTPFHATLPHSRCCTLQATGRDVMFLQILRHSLLCLSAQIIARIQPQLNKSYQWFPHGSFHSGSEASCLATVLQFTAVSRANEEAKCHVGGAEKQKVVGRPQPQWASTRHGRHTKLWRQVFVSSSTRCCLTSSEPPLGFLNESQNLPRWLSASSRFDAVTNICIDASDSFLCSFRHPPVTEHHAGGCDREASLSYPELPLQRWGENRCALDYVHPLRKPRYPPPPPSLDVQRWQLACVFHQYMNSCSLRCFTGADACRRKTKLAGPGWVITLIQRADAPLPGVCRT
ncbi:unnamed protein product [Pleuronectes platessa]|uniref:Uncharacterized protein n=1 Tax=Pleuronectes platessa TaxID=8262 RepID=A0A9N7YJG5_PLEPL|nr:unnamed protein product [Pleuronectes platessa]